MDIISLNEASTANGRIEKFIENPDSTSGVLTVPKTIAAGETITIPAGRVAILPDLQVDGDLVVDGDLFIPTGSMTSQVVQKVTSTDNAVVRFDGGTGEVQNSSILIDDSGNLNITGTGKRITGDFSNSTLSNRVAFQTSTPNSITTVNSLPNGTGSSSQFITHTSSDASNSSRCGINISANDAAKVFSDMTGTGSFLPLTFYTSGLERMRIDTAGNVGIGTSGPSSKLHIAGTNQFEGVRLATSYNLGEAVTFIDTTNSSNIADSNIFFKHETDGSSIITFGTTPAGSKSSDRRVERFIIDGNGNSLVVNSTGALGYGTGAGGIVTQGSSLGKGTPVVLDKPSGSVIMNNAALASQANIYFTISNNKFLATDGVVITQNDSGLYLGANYDVWVVYKADGLIGLVVKNLSPSTLSDAVRFRFDLIRGANS